MTDLRIFSFGGGVQSVAVMVLIAQQKVQYDALVFANVGADSENPATLRYIDTTVRPFCEEFGIEYVEVARVMGGKTVTLRGELERAEKSVIIPARMANGAPGNRNCTQDFKIRVIDKYIRATGTERCVVGLGISTDEFSRARDTEWHEVESDTAKHPRKLGFAKKREYPLIDLRLSRAACQALIAAAGLPVPPKSSCYFCPYTRRNEWIEMKRTNPALFAEAVEVERIVNEKRVDVGRDGVFLHSSLKPLALAVGDQLPLFHDPNDHLATVMGVVMEELEANYNAEHADDDECADGGYCMV